MTKIVDNINLLPNPYKENDIVIRVTERGIEEASLEMSILKSK